VSGGIAQLFLNLGTGRGYVGSASRSGRFYSRERPGTYCTGGWVGPGAGLDRCGKSLHTGIRSPDLPARSVVAIPTTLSRLPISASSWFYYKEICHDARLHESKIRFKLCSPIILRCGPTHRQIMLLFVIRLTNLF
jgi:hypothetical protein